MDTEPTTPRIVVGYDGSDQARAALHVAIEEARRRHARLEVVHAWTTPAVLAGMDVVPPPRTEYRAAAERLVRRAVHDLPDDVEGEARAVEGSAASSLLQVAHGADLVVVGSRGRGGFAGLVLGSTSHQVTAHATCPVLVVPAAIGERPRDTAGEAA